MEAKENFELNSYRDISINAITSGFYVDYNAEEIKNLIQDPMSNNFELRNLSRMVYNQNGIVTNTIDYMTSLPTLDYVLVPHGKNNTLLKKNKLLTEHILKKIRHKEFVRDALFKGMRDGIAFYYIETKTSGRKFDKFLSDFEAENIIEINDSPVNASIISLPTDYCQIVGIKNSSFVVAFNLDYFDTCSGESVENKLKKYPKEIRTAYQQRLKNNNIKNWVVLDNKHTITFKIRSTHDEKWGRPLALAALQDIFYSDYYIRTKRNVLDDINNKIIYQTFPQGEKAGISALSEKQQKKQHDIVKSAILNKNNQGGINFFSVPAGTKLSSVDTSVDLLDEKNETNINTNISTSLGFANSLLSANGTTSFAAQQSNLELVTSEVFQFIEMISSELNKCMQECIFNNTTNYIEVAYLPITHVNKKNMISFAKDLYLQGKGSLSLWASACGISSDIFFALLDEELELDVENKYPVHQTSYTQSPSASGRPEVDSLTNENTVRSKSNNSNGQPKPSST